MIVLWFFNERFNSPFLLGLIFAVQSGADVISFLFGPLIDNSNCKKLLVNCTIIQIVDVIFIVIYSIVFGVSENLYSAVFLTISVFITTISSVIIYPLQVKMIPMVAEDTPLVKVNGIFHIADKIFDIFFNALATLFISNFVIKFNLIITVIVFLIALRLYSLIKYDKYYNFNENDDYEEQGTIKDYLEDIKEGVDVLKNQYQILKLIMPLMLINFFYAISEVGLPAISKEYISSDAIGYGYVLSICAIGSLIGGIFSQIKNIEKIDIKKLVSVCLFFAGASQFAFAYAIKYNIIYSYISIFISCAFVSFMNVLFISLVQSLIPIHVLGRVETINESIICAVIPLGSMVGAYLLSNFNSILTQYIYGLILIVFGIYYTLLRFKKS